MKTIVCETKAALGTAAATEGANFNLPRNTRSERGEHHRRNGGSQT